jgi:hypothetical protein
MAMYIRGMSNAHSAIDDLLRQPILDDLPVLDLSFAPCYMSSYYRNSPAPPSMFRFSPTLRVLRISCEYSRIEFSMNDACCAIDIPHL